MTQPNGTSAIEPPMVTAPAPQPAPLADGGTKCVASENPEWATASAAKKKELLDACR